MSFKNEKVFLVKSEQALAVAVQHAEISEALSKFTYNPDKIGEGKVIFDETKQKYQIHGLESL